MVSRIGSTHRLGAQTEDVSAFQNSTHTQAIPEINTDYLISRSRTEEYTSFLRARYRLPRTGSAMENGSHGHGFGTERYGLFRTITGFPALRDARGILCRGRVNRTAQSLYTLRQSGGMEKDPPHGSSWPFYLHAPGLTLVTLGTACVPSACIPFARFPFPKLRINRNAHVSF
jgi:hypothetical protein